MKKTGVFLACLLFAFTVTGCGSTFDTEESAVYIKGNGTILEASIEEFDADYYDEKELENFVDESIQAYEADHEKGSVKKGKLEVKDKTATLFLKYQSGEDFAAFHGEEFFCGTLAEALAAGYNLDEYTTDGSYKSVEDSETYVSASEMEGDMKVVIMKERMGVKVKGTICYVSDNVEVTGKDTVTPAKDKDGKIMENYGDEYIVVFYK